MIQLESIQKYQQPRSVTFLNPALIENPCDLVTDVTEHGSAMGITDSTYNTGSHRMTSMEVTVE